MPHCTAAQLSSHGRDELPVGMDDVRYALAMCEKDLEAIKVTCFTDAEHNSKTNVMLEFERSVKVRHQVVARTMHHFTIETKEMDSGKKLYKDKVWAAWKSFKQLQSFEPIGDAAVTPSEVQVLSQV